MLAQSSFRHSYHYHIDKWLDLFSQFDMTIYHTPGKSNVVANALSSYPDLAAVIDSVDSGLLTQIREA